MTAVPPHVLVTDEVEACIGTSVTYEAPEIVDGGAIRYFALATGSNPARWAKEAPPTFVCETNQLTGIVEPDHNGYLGHTWSLPFPQLVDMVRGGNDYHFHHPIRPGHRIFTTWTLTSVEERGTEAGHPLAVATAEAAYRLAEGDLMATNTETLLYRPTGASVSGRSASGRSAAGAGSADRSGGSTGLGPSEATGAPGAPGAATSVGVACVSEGLGGSESAGSASSSPTLFGGHVRPAVGDRLRPLERTIGLVDLVAYGAATWDWHRLHYDADHAVAAGLPAPVVDGQMFGALLAEQVTRWLGRSGRIGRLHYRNRAPVHPGSTLRCEGEVVDVGRAGCVVRQQVLVDGVPVVEPAGAEIRLDGAM